MDRFKGLLKIVTQPIFLVFLLFVVSGVSIYFINEYRQASTELETLKGDPATVTEEEIEELENQVRRLTVLPEGETPTVATVTDVDSIDQNQQFFQYAENGDKVLIYTEARRAILYRPSTDRIIEIAPINLNQQEGLDQQAEPQEQVTEEEEEGTKKLVRLAIYNGVLTGEDQTESVIEAIDGEFTDVEFDTVARLGANKEYEDTAVVVLVQGYEEEANKIAQVLGGSVTTVQDELLPEADILVIIGKSFQNN